LVWMAGLLEVALVRVRQGGGAEAGLLQVALVQVRRGEGVEPRKAAMAGHAGCWVGLREYEMAAMPAMGPRETR